jgi:hypothetical protein
MARLGAYLELARRLRATAQERPPLAYGKRRGCSPRLVAFRRCAAMRRPGLILEIDVSEHLPGLADAQWLDHCQLTITDAIKNVSRTLSGHTDVDLHRDVVYVRVTLSFGLLWLRQCSASLDPKCGNGRQLIGGSGDARSVFNRKPLRQGASGCESKLRNQNCSFQERR